MRQLVTLRKVREIIPIEGADRIELAKIDGWQCVVPKGAFAVGDEGYYCEIDSILPNDDPRFAFLEQRKFRIKSMKLRGVLSQGLLQPLSTLTEDELSRMRAGESLTDILRVQKYEPPVPISGQQKGTFPTHLVPKTDQERIQNIPDLVVGRNASEFEVTEKLDGTSCTFFAYREQLDGVLGAWNFGACSRNWEMDLEDSNVYAKLFGELDLQVKLFQLGRNIAIQGEIIGPAIQGNKYQRGKQEFYVFDIYDIDARSYVTSTERMELARELGLNHVPVLSYHELLMGVPEAQPVQQGCDDFSLSLDVVLAMADGQSMLYGTPREGLVFKHRTDPSLTFKAISNKFLLKTGE